MASHADRMGILSKDQHGFRKHHSTATNLLTHYDKIVERLEGGESVDIVLLYMSRAFDRVSHYKLIKHLKRSGYRGRILHFIHNMLNNRSQKVYANGVLSEPLPVISGTPQGVALSPYLWERWGT